MLSIVWTSSADVPRFSGGETFTGHLAPQCPMVVPRHRTLCPAARARARANARGFGGPGPGVNPVEVQNLDTDGSGNIDYTEFMAATLTKKQYLRRGGKTTRRHVSLP